MGRVVEFAPAWLIKATGFAPSSRYVNVLLDSRPSDNDRSNGIWLSVPEGCLQVQ
jgi:hypothetical protein